MKNLKLLLFILLSITQNGWAHPLDIGLLNLKNDGNVLSLQLELNPAAAQILLPDTQLTDWKLKGEELFQSTLKNQVVKIDGLPCQWEAGPQIVLVTPENISLLVKAVCPKVDGKLALDFEFLKKMETTFNLIIKTNLNGNERILSATPQSSALVVDGKEARKSFIDFIIQGIKHIGVSKDQWIQGGQFSLPAGIDHILFLLALVLSGGNFITLLKMVSGFTLGHTIAVALAAFRIVNIPGEYVEPIIALTIALVSLDALMKFGLHRKWIITLVIGLIHGLAFAEALIDLDLSAGLLIQAVLGFNIGVEVAQAILIALLFPIYLNLKKRDFSRRFVLPSMSVMIIIIGSYWFVERVWSVLAA